ncbi:MAG TPA: hypothetical protein VEH50_07540 [Methylomirabilota bacterium]|nr:hypothetical protein [Methylomirabilota bacterium]
MSAETAVIANVTENSWTLHRTYGTFFIQGVPAREPIAGDVDAPGPEGRTPASRHACALTVVTPRTSVMDLGDRRTMELHVSAREIAEDLCREINGDAGEDSFLGVFVCAGDEPSEEELAAAGRRLEAFYRRKVAEADREWARSHSHLFLDDLQRRAARMLGLEREWNYELRESAECPGCGERLKPNVAVCKSCGAILNREKAAQLGLVPAAASPGDSIDANAPAPPAHTRAKHHHPQPATA